MKYQITCGHCDTRFLVEGKGGQTIECQCPGCGGTMRVALPKTDKKGQPEDAADDEGYQVGYAPADEAQQTNGGDDSGNERRHHRALALGCLFFIVVVAAAMVAFMALNHTTKKPIDDPYEYFEPDTATADTVPEDTEEVVVDTVQVHEEKPKVQAAPADSVDEAAEPATTEEQDNTEQPADANAESTDKSPAKDSHSSAEPAASSTKASAKTSAKEKTSKKPDNAAPAAAKE